MASLLVLVVAVTSLLGCQEGKRESDRPPKEQIASKPVIEIALLPSRNVFSQKRRYRAIAKYLAHAAGMEVRTRLLDSYEAIYNEMLTGKVHAAFFGALSYAVISSYLDVTPIARPVRDNGAANYSGVVFAPRGKGITSDIGTWKGKRIALVSKSTTSGYLFPRWYLNNAGIKNFEGYFRKVIYAGSHDAAVLAVLRNEADMGCTTDLILQRMFSTEPAMVRDLEVVATSVPFPSNTLGIKTDSLDPEFRRRLEKALINMDKNEDGRKALSELGVTRFVLTKDSDFDSVRGMMQDLGLKPDFFTLGQIGRDRQGRQ